MAWRKWYVRFLVFTIVGCCAGAAYLYQRFTNPSAVREQLAAKLKTLFPGAVTTIDTAQLRILGGISVNELRLFRKDDPDKNEILHVPSAVIYHDKEKILDGEFCLRRVEFFRPHLRAQRNKDGTWNLQGIAGPQRNDLPMPTLVIHKGTIVLEDRGENGTGASMELTDVDLQIINDPLPLVTIQGSAHSEIAGNLHLTGQWQRQTHEITLTLKAERISLASIMAEGLEKLCPPHLFSRDAERSVSPFEGLKLEGTADLRAELAYNPQAAQPLSYDVRLNVASAKIQHPKLPLPLEEVELSLHACDGAVYLERVKAKSGLTEIAASGWALLHSWDQDFEGHLEARHLEMNKNLFDPLPKKWEAHKLYTMFSPTGQATFRADVRHRADSWVSLASGEPSAIQLVSESLGVTFFKFRYPLEKLSGTVDYNLMTKVTQLDAIGYSGPHPVVVKGTWQGKGDQVDCRFDIDAKRIPLDEKFIVALPGERAETDRPLPNFQKLAREFNAQGQADITAHIRHKPGDKEFHTEYHARFYDTSIRWAPFPYPLENVSGYLDIYPHFWKFREGKGTHHGGEVLVQGGSLQHAGQESGANPGIVLFIGGSKVPVDEDLHQALAKMQQLGKSWETFRPRGLLDFRAEIKTANPADADVELEIRGVAIEPVFFPYALEGIIGKFHYNKNKLEILGASARHLGTKITLDHGLVDIQPGGGQYTDLTGLKADDLVLDEAFIRALPTEAGKSLGGLRSAATALQMHGAVAITTRLIVSQKPESGSPAEIFWDGQCRLKNVQFTTGLEWTKVTGTIGSRGLYNGRQLADVRGAVLLEEATLLGQPIRDLQASFQIKDTSPDVLTIENLRAPLFGGDISGQVRVNFNSTLSYELDLTGSQIDLAQFSRQNLGQKSQLTGAVMGRLYLTGQGSGIDSLEGNGSIDVPNGQLVNLPLLLDLLKYLRIRGPERTTFEKLHAEFGIHGKRVAMRKLELLGSAISLSGQGEFNLDGTNVALDFYPGLLRLEPYMPVMFRPISAGFSKSLLTIEMRGKITADEKDRKFTMKPVPGITDPILYLHHRLLGLPNQDNRDEPKLLPMLGEGR